MAKVIKTEIVINASKEEVWDTLMDFENYPNWNPFITEIEGEKKLGGKLKVKIVPPNSKGMIFKPNVTKLNVNSSFSWLGHLGIKGLFDGEHKFELKDNLDGTTTFIQSEQFSGILVWMINLRHTKNGFEEMNIALKRHIESLNPIK